MAVRTRGPHSIRRASASAAALVIVALATACLPPYQGNPAGPRVAIVGDSIVNYSTDALHIGLDRDHQVLVDGQISATIGQRLDTVVGLFDQPAPPDILVIELGTNDAQNFGYGRRLPLPQPAFNQSLYDSSLGIWRMLSAAQHARCIVLVDINAHTGRPWLNEWASAWNTVFLPAFATSYPQVRVASWDQQVAAFGWDITSDSIHPNAWGQLIFAVTVANAINTCP